MAYGVHMGTKIYLCYILNNWKTQTWHKYMFRVKIRQIFSGIAVEK